MYKVYTEKCSFLTESLCYIRQIYPGGYLVTSKETAEGISHHGTPYLFSDGVSIAVTDAGDDIENLNREDTANKAAQADAETAMVEQDILMDQRLTDIEMALVELDKAQNGGM